MFWVIVVVAVLGLAAYGVYRAGLGGKTTAQPGGPGTRAPRAEGTVEVLFYSSSAKKTWIDQMVAQFNAEKRRVGRQEIVVKAVHGNSGEQLDQLKEGKIKPDLWSPGDESWLDLAAAHWQTVRQTTLFDSYTPLVNIPLVITMWEPMARALGYPAKPLGWLDIAKLAAAPGGWADYGHPEWGKFRWGHAHPDANSGFLSVVSEVYASLGKTEGITAEDLRSPKVVEFLKEFEGAVEHYGLSNSWIDDLMHLKGPSYLSCAAQYENTIIESNQKHQNMPFKLVALYPKEGNFWTRHPTAILQEAWVTAEKREAAKVFLDYLLSRDAQAAAMRLGLRPILTDVQLTSPFDDEHGVQIAVDADASVQGPRGGRAQANPGSLGGRQDAGDRDPRPRPLQQHEGLPDGQCQARRPGVHPIHEASGPAHGHRLQSGHQRAGAAGGRARVRREGPLPGRGRLRRGQHRAARRDDPQLSETP